MDNIILVGHGSPKKDANNLDVIARLLHGTIHPGCLKDCVKVAYMEFAKPAIPEALEDSAATGAERIIVHPFFLSSGVHVTKDIPAMISEARAKFPGTEFLSTEPLGVHQNLVGIVLDRLKSVKFDVPLDIEKRSFEILSGEVDLDGLPQEQVPVIQRVIHSTADFEFRDSLSFHPDAVAAGVAAIRAGKNILTDIEMVRAGINKKLLERWGGKVVCSIADPEVVRLSEKTGNTRSEIAMQQSLTGEIGIVAIGNAPTALLKVIELINAGEVPQPLPLVVGVPVGFVKALESKALLASQPFPFITNLSRKGGTPVAVAIINALLKLAAE